MKILLILKICVHNINLKYLIGINVFFHSDFMINSEFFFKSIQFKKRMEGVMEKEMYEDDNMFYRFLRGIRNNI